MSEDESVEFAPHVSPAMSGKGLRATAIACGSLWVVAMTAVYALTIISTLSAFAHRIPFRTDRRWMLLLAAAVLCAVAFIVIVVLQLVLRRLPLLRICFLGTVLLGVTVVVLRQQVRAVMVVAWLMLLAFLWGDWTLRKWRAQKIDNAAEWVVVACALGLTLLSLLALALGVVGLSRPDSILLALALATVVQMRSLVRLARTLLESARTYSGYLAPGQPEEATLKFLLALIVLFNLGWALSPETSYDALNYQLAVPRFYLESGSIIDLPYFWHSYFARLVNGLFLLALGLGGQLAVKLLVMATGLITATAVYALSRDLLDRRAGLWAFAIFYSTPMVAWLSTVAYVDLTLGMFVITAWLAFLRWQNGAGIGWLLASGALSGAIVGTKPNGAYALPVIVMVVLWATARRDRLLGMLRGVTAFGVTAMIVAFPWYLVPWYYTGNPVFPLLNGVFKSPYWEPVNSLMNSSQFGLGNSLGSYLRLPFALTFETNRFDELLPSGGIGLALVLLPLAFLRTAVSRQRLYLLLAATAVYLILWAKTFQYARYYIPVLPLVAALAITGVMAWTASGWPRKLNVVMLWVAFVAQGLLIGASFGDVANRNPLQLISRQRTEEEYLERAMPPYRAVQFINSVTEPGDWVIGEGVDYLRYYLKPPLVSMPESMVLRSMIVGGDEQELADRFARAGYRYVLLNRPALKRKWRFLQPSFLERFATLEFSYNSSDVYRLHGSTSERRSGAPGN